MKKYFSLNFGTFSGKYHGKQREFLFHKMLGTLACKEMCVWRGVGGGGGGGGGTWKISSADLPTQKSIKKNPSDVEQPQFRSHF